MTDRELLEAAAKAAGLEFHWVRLDGGHVLQASMPGSRTEESWNPLTDDGDALRLLVKLSMRLYVYQDEGDECSIAAIDEPATFATHTDKEKHQGDPYAATRRSIVRAAAALATSLSKEVV